MNLKRLAEWAQAQIDNTAKPEVRPDVGITVLQLVEEMEKVTSQVEELKEKLQAQK